jgi:hypothetical protein
MLPERVMEAMPAEPAGTDGSNVKAAPVKLLSVPQL